MLSYYLKLSWLSIKRTPILTTLMVVAIGLGIAVSITVLTVNYMMGKDPIPEKSHQLFHVQLYTYGKGYSNSYSTDQYPWQVTYQDAMNLHKGIIPLRQTRSLATGFSVIPEFKGDAPFLEPARAIDHQFFEMFNVPFLFGGTWDEQVDQLANNVIVIDEDLNNRLFKGENSIGKQINLNSIYYTIVGVIKKWQPTQKFYDLNNGYSNDVESIFIPFSLLPVHEIPSWGSNNGWKTEEVHSYQDKLASEITWNQFWVELPGEKARADYQQWLEGYISEQKKIGRFQNEKSGASLKNVIQWLNANQVVPADNSILIGLSFMFLAVCMINTIGLLLAKFLRRASEVGVRRALGASRNAIFTQHLVDVALIGLLGGGLGLALGQLGLLAIRRFYSLYAEVAHMDVTLIILAIVISLTSSVIAGMYPAWLICRTNPSDYLKIQ